MVARWVLLIIGTTVGEEEERERFFCGARTDDSMETAQEEVGQHDN